MARDEPEEFDEMGVTELARDFGRELDLVDAQLSRDVERVEEIPADDERVGWRVLRVGDMHLGVNTWMTRSKGRKLKNKRTTAWIHPVGMKAVFPSLRSIRYTRSQLSPNQVDSCRSDEPDHSSYAFKLAGVGRIKKNVLPPRRTW